MKPKPVKIKPTWNIVSDALDYAWQVARSYKKKNDYPGKVIFNPKETGYSFFPYREFVRNGYVHIQIVPIEADLKGNITTTHTRLTSEVKACLDHA